MANVPFFYFKVWRGKSGKLWGSQLELSEYQGLLKLRYKLMSFAGRLATVCIVTDDISIARKEELDFASNFMKGSYVKIEVDLNRCTSRVTTTNPPP